MTTVEREFVYETIVETVEAARRRLASRRAWHWGGRVALVGSAAVLALVLVRLVVSVTVPYGLLTGLALGAGVFVALVLLITWRIPPHLAAQVLDHRCGGADRMTTAFEVMTGRIAPTALTGAAVRDAALWASLEAPARRLAARPGPAIALAVVTAAAAAVLGWGLTGVSLPGTPAHEVAATIRREGRRLERAAGTIEERARLDRAPTARRVAPSLRRLGEIMARERLERAEALARIEALGREVEAARRQIQARREQSGSRAPQPGAGLPPELFRRRAALDRTIRQFQELAGRLGQGRSPEERSAMLRQLEALARGGSEGDVPVRTREQAEEARRQLASGDAGAARQTLQQGAADLEELQAMLADEEGLTQAQRDLRRSADRIARGGASAEPEQSPQAGPQPGGAAPGSRALPQGEGAEAADPPPGPHQGTTAGQGTVAEKLGPRTPRLEAERSQTRVRGLQGEGRVTTSDLLGPGRPGQVRAAPGRDRPAARAEADRYMARMRIPPEYREIVRRYFEALAASR